MSKLTWRPNPDEIQSVRKYSTALGTMAQVSERIGRLSGDSRAAVHRSDRVDPHSIHITEGGTGERAGGTGERAHPEHRSDVFDASGPTRIELTGYEPEVEGIPVFEDGPQSDAARSSTVAEIAPEFRSERARKQALHSMDHHARRGMTSVVVVVVVVAFGVLAYVGGHRSTSHAAANTRASIVSSKHPSTARHRVTGSHRKSSHRGSTGPTTTTTTQAPSQLVATSSTGASAVYPVTSDSYAVVVTASAACWVDAVIASSGVTAWTGTLQPGSSKVIQATGAMTVELGAFGASMTVDDVPVVFPTPYQAPFTATFEPESPGTPSPTSTSAGTTSSSG